ncbi:DinB family protein [Kribbella sp. NPDC051718]|uniref:DinB family protein n=1 Tax=Kribbella sp. NPDC051718 TaxID=3155168 RepID=UPI00341D51E1
MGMDQLLHSFLEAQRARVFEVVEGLSTEQLTRSVLPSGWTVLGMIEHLGGAERHWFQQVALGAADPLPWPDDPADADNSGDSGDDDAFTSGRSPEAVFGFYRDQIARANEVLATVPWDTPPVGDHGQGDTSQITDLRFIVLHLIEETARHLGHLDAARELIDGRTALGQDPL